MRPRLIAALCAASTLTAPLAAHNSAVEFDVAAQSSANSEIVVEDQRLARFVPSADRTEHRIDYSHWDEALAWMVIPMGPSIRKAAPRVEPITGTRRIYGHESRFRLEGNRLAFSMITPQVMQALGDYKADLERIGTELDLTRLPRNEQLAFWLNLHNVAVVEALAGQWPLLEPDDGEYGSEGTGLDDAKLVTIDGVALSPRDIREGIVYPNWRDPKVIYGFWRGAIGGPSIQRLAFNAANVDAVLALSAEEFVNSLRGVEEWGDTLRVSPIYREAAPFYFEDFGKLRTHLSQFAAEDVQTLLNQTQATAYTKLETDLADMSRGERDPALNFVGFIDCRASFCSPNDLPAVSSFIPYRGRINLPVQRLMRERYYKLQAAERRGIRLGMVIYGDGQYAEGEGQREVE